MPTIKPFDPDKREGYTIINNDILDYVMPRLSPSAWKILCLVIRKTRGYQKEEDAISISQIKNHTGIQSRTTISDALKSLEDEGLIKAIRPNDKVSSNIYSLNIHFEIDVPSPEIELPGPKSGLAQNEANEDASPEVEPASPENGLGVVQKMDTQKKDKNKKRITTNVVGDKSPPAQNGIGPRTILSNKFTSISGIPVPTNTPDKKYWWNRINAILETTQRDVDVGLELMQEAYTKLDADGLAISGPGSLVKTIKDLVRKRNQPKQKVRLSAK